MAPPRKNRYGELVFPDFTEFRPNLTPREMFQLGSFGGTYWRPIRSAVTKKSHRGAHNRYPDAWWRGIPPEHLTAPWDAYDKQVNLYKVRVGSTLEEWEEKDWITQHHPYGWVQWYCDFFSGRRGPDDARQINRWVRTAGPKSRFRHALINLVHKQQTTFDDVSVSPRRRQTLQHWAYRLTARDCVP